MACADAGNDDAWIASIRRDHPRMFFNAQTVAHNCVLVRRPNEPLPRSTPTRAYTFDELMEPLFVSLREYLADGLEKPFLVRGTDRVYGD